MLTYANMCTKTKTALAEFVHYFLLLTVVILRLRQYNIMYYYVYLIITNQ